jgi:carbohydrate kinase (thermoresistant glucokinase family)
LPGKLTVGARGASGVLTCSTLKQSYRDIIINDRPEVKLIYLKGSRDLLHRRMTARQDHFMHQNRVDLVRDSFDEAFQKAEADVLPVFLTNCTKANLLVRSIAT